MTNVVITWTDPSVPGGIDFIDIQASVDGENYSSIAQVPAGAQTLTDQDVSPGTWFYQAIVVPTSGRASDPVRGSIEIPAAQAPGVTNFALTLSP